MNPRDYASLLAALLAALSSVGPALEGRETTKAPPNIVFILADDLGYGELGCYGQKWIRTPHIDRMARQGIRFTQHYAGNAVCAPSRCALLTGKHPGHATIRDNGDPKDLGELKARWGWEFPGQHPIPAEEVTLAEVLKERGYATAAVGKWGLGHVGTSGDPNRQGFDLFYGYLCQRHAHNHYPRFLWRNGKKERLPGNDRTLSGTTYSQDRFTQVAMDFVRAHRDGPFFLYLAFAVPHLSIQVPEESLALYKGKIPEEEYVHRGYLEHPFPRAGYAAMVSHMDRDVGRILALLDELGIDGRTLVLFSSDNGPTYGRLGGSDSAFFGSAGPFRGFKGSLYEGGIRVPLVARWPGRIAPGRVSDHAGAFWDLLPAIAEIAGSKTPPGVDGVSYAPALLGEREAQRQPEHLYWEFPGYGGQQAVRLGDWKALRQGILRRDNPEPLRIELYDLKTDPGERRNVARERPDVVATARRIFAEARRPSALFPMRPLDAPERP